MANLTFIKTMLLNKLMDNDIDKERSPEESYSAYRALLITVQKYSVIEKQLPTFPCI